MPPFFVRMLLCEDHFRGMKIDQASIPGYQNAFVGNVRGVDLADNLDSLLGAGKQDDVRRILFQPTAIRDRKMRGIHSVSLQESGSLSKTSPNSDAEARSLPRVKFRGDTVTGVGNPSHAIRIGRTGNNFRPIA